MTVVETPDKQSIRFRSPELKDGFRIHRLIERCKPLDLNSPYLYFLLSHHFNEYCVAAEAGSSLVGAVTAYRPPKTPDVLFIWQIAVDASMRGRGLGIKMLEHLLARDICRGIRFLELTVSPSNTASRKLFTSLAKKLNAELSEREFLTQEHFSGSSHEEELLFRIGPFKIQQTKEVL